MTLLSVNYGVSSYLSRNSSSVLLKETDLEECSFLPFPPITDVPGSHGSAPLLSQISISLCPDPTIHCLTPLAAVGIPVGSGPL